MPARRPRLVPEPVNVRLAAHASALDVAAVLPRVAVGVERGEVDLGAAQPRADHRDGEARALAADADLLTDLLDRHLQRVARPLHGPRTLDVGRHDPEVAVPVL